MANPSPKTNPAYTMKKITPSADPLNPRPRSIYVAVSGKMSIGNGDGSVEDDIDIVAGSEIHCQFDKIISLTDAVVYGLY